MRISFILLIVLTLFSCREEKPKKIQSAFERTWFSGDAHLIIKPDNIFEFTRYTCISHSSAKGYWKNSNDTLILNSIRPEGCYFEEEFIILPSDSSTHYKIAIQDCMPNTGFVNFKNEKFYIKDALLMSKTSPLAYDGKLSEVYNFRKTKEH